MAAQLRLRASRKRARIKRTAGYSSAIEGRLIGEASILTILGALVVISVILKLLGLY